MKGRDFLGIDETETPGRNQWISSLCRSAGFKARLVASVDGVTHVLSRIASESFVTLLPAYFLGSTHPGVVFRPLVDTKAGWDFILLRQKGRMTPAMRALVEAPEASRTLLSQVAGIYGFTPNLYGVLAESPVALSTYLAVLDLLKAHSSLTPQQQQIAMLAVSRTNGCDYCVAAHSTVAGMTGVPGETVCALRGGNEPDSPGDAALVRFANAVVEHRGWIPESEQEACLDAGFTARQVLDVLTIIGLKTLSNYTDHFADTPLDEAFAEHEWKKGESAEA